MRNLITKSVFVFIFGIVATCAYSQIETRVVDGKNYVVHKVASGETLYKLSKKYNATVQAIKEANGGSESIKIGQELLIPYENTPPTTTVTVETANVEIVNLSQHTVKSGETLSKIAVKYNTTVAYLKEINELSNTDIKIGQKLKVPVGSGSGITVVETEQPAATETIVRIDKPVVKPAITNVQQPSNPRNITTDTGSKINKGVVGGMPENAEIVLAETATEKEESAIAVVQDAGMDQTRTFIKHPTLSKGSIVVVINESTGKMAYCRVVDNVKIADLDGASIAITKAVADKIGVKVSPSTVKIRYATP